MVSAYECFRIYVQYVSMFNITMFNISIFNISLINISMFNILMFNVFNIFQPVLSIFYNQFYLDFAKKIENWL